MASCAPVVGAGGGTVIEAAQFASLQAAFDAVPTNGGLVRLPPGEFVLSEPLVLSVGDTRIEGTGAATHSINRSTNGQPALVIAPGTSAVTSANFRSPFASTSALVQNWSCTPTAGLLLRAP